MAIAEIFTKITKNISVTTSQNSFFVFFLIFFFENISEWLLLKVGWEEICMVITYLVFFASFFSKRFAKKI